MEDTKNFIELLIDKGVYTWGGQTYKQLKKFYNMYYEFKGDYHFRNIINTLININLLKSKKINNRFHYTFIYNGYREKEDKSGIVRFQ
jgi:hypothetical protein|tara:strand:+ start:89 stop:352 length:264 start_codon:yes stop_codon:yes gene_type:complete